MNNFFIIFYPFSFDIVYIPWMVSSNYALLPFQSSNWRGTRYRIFLIARAKGGGRGTHLMWFNQQLGIQ